MNNISKIVTIATALLVSVPTLANKPLIGTDSDELFRVGSTPKVAEHQKVVLEAGLYEAGPLDEVFGEEYYFVIDKYVNDDDKFLGILIPKKAAHGTSYKNSTARLYQGRPIKGGEIVMFSPVGIDNSGNLRTLSEMQTNAPVLEVIARDGRYHYPYLMRPRNDALNGRLFGLKGSSTRVPELRPAPSSGVFASADSSRVNLMVSGREISFADQTYNLLPLNGEYGKFAALTKSTLDTMAEYELADERVKRLATFISGCWDEEKLMILTPGAIMGEYNLQMYHLATPNIIEWLFPGRRAPDKNGSRVWIDNEPAINTMY